MLGLVCGMSVESELVVAGVSSSAMGDHGDRSVKAGQSRAMSRTWKIIGRTGVNIFEIRHVVEFAVGGGLKG